MNVRRFVLLTASIAMLSSGLFSDSPVLGQSPSPASEDAVDRVRLFDSLEQPVSRSRPADVSSSKTSVQGKMSVAELRQARALYRSNQRAARHEYNLWMGNEPLRPNWNAIPMMTSRYPNRQVYIPVYVRAQ